MKCSSFHRKCLSRHNLVLVIVAVSASLFQSVKCEPSPQFNSDSFIDTDQDLLALPSDAHPQIERTGPVTSYAFEDNTALESNPPGAVVVAPPPEFQQQQQQQQEQSASEQHQQYQQQQQSASEQHQQYQNAEQYAQNVGAGSNIVTINEYPQQQQPTVLHQVPVQHSYAQYSQYSPHATLPFYGEAVAAVPYAVPVVAATPVVVGHPTAVYVPEHQPQVVQVGAQIGHGLAQVAHLATHQAGFLEIYNHILKNPHKALELLFVAAQRLAIPKDHYLNVISFVGIYLFMSMLMYSTEDVLQTTCEVAGGNKKSIHKEWYYHAGRRFVPYLPVDKKLQKQFLKLFRGPHLEDDASGSSSEEDFSGELGSINELMPKGSFFYSLSPVHIEAWRQMQRLFVMQKGPLEVYHLAKDLLYHQKVNPKIWYLGLIAAAQERPDMTGFNLAHPLDAMPDWFIPAHLIKDEMDRYRFLTEERQRTDLRGKRIKREIEMIPLVPGRNGTYVSRSSAGKSQKFKHRSGMAYENDTSTTTLSPLSSTVGLSDSGEMSGEFVGLDGSVISRGNSGNQLEFTKQKKAKNEANEETVEVSDKQLEEAMLRHGSSLARQNKPKPSYGGGKKPTRYTPKRKTPGRNKKKGSHDKHKGEKEKDKKKHKGKDEDEDEDCIRVDGKLGEVNGIENKLWYFREDIQMNQHHWYWHQVFPLNATRHNDRRAELFFSMHRQFVSRYNAERLSNGLPLVYEMDYQPGGVIHEGYNSHLADLSSGKHWTPRPPKQILTDIMHLDDPNFARNIEMPEIMAVYGRIMKAIKTGKMIGMGGKQVKIANEQGIELLGNVVEATELNVNPFAYDFFGLHNTGHMQIGYASDPYYKAHTPPGPMAEQAMSMRDPAFYPYHVFIDNIFEKYKSKLAPYKIIGGQWQLLWRGVEVQHVEILSKGHNTVNQLRTFWTDRKFELSPGVDRTVDLDDGEEGKVCAVHLSHEPFLFKFVVERKPCARTKTGKATIRIFMAPRYDEKGRRLHINEQRRLMFQLDAFQAKLRVGKNIITRRSHDSSLTKPWTRSIKEMEHAAGQGGAADFCGCGWPQHLYIPKGNPHGMPFDLFVMATNYDEDKVANNPKDLAVPERCNSPYIFCGLPRRRYPDARPMMYPFDRPINRPLIPCLPKQSFGSMVCHAFNMVFLKQVDTLEHFVSRAPNMKSLTFTIKHIDHFYPSPGWSSNNN